MQILVIILCIMIGFILLMFTLLIMKFSGGGKLILTKPNIKHEVDPEAMSRFAGTEHGKQIAKPYRAKLKSNERKINRLERIGRRTGSSQVAKRIQRLADQNIKIESSMAREIGIFSRPYADSKHKGKGARIRGNKVSLGIRREGHGGHFETSESTSITRRSSVGRTKKTPRRKKNGT